MSRLADTQARNYKLFCGGLAIASFGIATFCGATTGAATGAVSALLVALAAFVVGGLIGFLFGIPKSLQETESRHAWQTNTNLEQVSDWLTKILIGVGLTQLSQIPGKLRSTAEYLAGCTGLSCAPAIFAMLVVFAGGGFVIGYLLTKFDMGHAIDLQDGLLDAALDANPSDRKAVESYMLGMLYKTAPAGFEKVIQAGESFLQQEGHPEHPQDADVYAYLTCAYGQKYRYVKDTGGSGLDAVRQAVIANATLAIKDDPKWQERFRRLLNPTMNSKDNDLEALKDDPELEKLLGIEPVPADPAPKN